MRWFRTLIYPPSFPSDVPQSDAPFPPPGPAGQFPGFTSTAGRSDCLPPFPPHFVAFAWRYRSLCARVSLPSPAERSRRRPGVFDYPVTPRSGSYAEAAGPPRFLGNPSAYMPCSLTPVGPPRQAISALQCCLPPYSKRRLPRREPFGAQSHGLHTRCLRSVTTVTRSHVRLASGCWPSFAGRGWLPAGFPLRVSELVTSHPPCPGFSWRTVALGRRPQVPTAQNLFFPCAIIRSAVYFVSSKLFPANK